MTENQAFQTDRSKRRLLGGHIDFKLAALPNQYDCRVEVQYQENDFDEVTVSRRSFPVGNEQALQDLRQLIIESIGPDRTDA